jgi:hypothetical protein
MLQPVLSTLVLLRIPPFDDATTPGVPAKKTDAKAGKRRLSYAPLSDGIAKMDKRA